MRNLRLTWRLPTLLLLCVPVALLTFVGGLLSGRAGARLRDLASRAFGRGVLAVLGGRLTVSGPVPAPPYALVSNHLGYLDVVVLLAALSRPRFVSKAEVRRWPLFGVLAQLGGTIFLQRERARDLPRTVRAMQAVLNAGDGIVFFPEGTSSGGEDLLPFRASLFAPLARLQIPLHCASLRYEGWDGGLPAGEWLCWWRDMPFGRHFLRLLRGPGFRAELRFASDTLFDEDRKRLAAAAEERVRSVFEPTLPRGISMTELDRILAMHRLLLGDAEQLLSGLSDELYASTELPVASDGIGAHLRHVLEFYAVLFEALDEDAVVDYDRRPRDVELEKSRVRAIERLRETRKRIDGLQMDRPLRVLHDHMEEQSEASASSLSRELRFVASHSVHHFAIVAMLLRLSGQEPPADFGVAPSTLSYRRRVGIASS